MLHRLSLLRKGQRAGGNDGDDAPESSTEGEEQEDKTEGKLFLRSSHHLQASSGASGASVALHQRGVALHQAALQAFAQRPERQSARERERDTKPEQL